MGIKHEFNRFLNDVYRIIGHRIPYMCVPEPQKNGNPHLHILFFGVTRIMDWREVKKYWKIGSVYLNRTIENKHIKNSIEYITKYLTKTFSKTTGANVLAQALVWLFEVRSFTTSEGLMPSLSKKSWHRYELMGTVWCFFDEDWRYLECDPENFDALLSSNG